MALDERKGVWKSGKGRGRKFTKGRQYDDAALSEVQSSAALTVGNLSFPIAVLVGLVTL